MTVTVFEYRDGEVFGKAEVSNLCGVGLFIKQRIDELGLTPNDDETYNMPDGQVVNYTIDHKGGLEILKEAISPKEVA